MDFEFDPRDLIGPPFRECPRCGKPAFGSLSIDGESHTRRCRECFLTKAEPLWPLKKKVIYVDQFAISNMMKALDVTARGHDRARADAFWLALFEALERVCKLQLAICPDSEQHQEESLVSPFFAALKRMYEQLSHGVTFYDTERIAQEQLHVAVTAWTQGRKPVHDLTTERVTRGALHAWQDRIIVSVDMSYPPEMVDGIRDFRDRVHEGVIASFEECRQSSERSYDHWFEREKDAPRRGIVGSLRARARRELVRSSGLDRADVIWHALRQSGVSPNELQTQFVAFLESDALREIPVSLIATRMWAVIAQKAASGQKEPPNRGTVNDINVVSGLMPYCDVMLIDNKCRALIEDIPEKYALSFDTQIFSRSNGEEFLEFIKDIERTADPVILKLVHNVYGDDWPTPFVTMYEQERERKARRVARQAAKAEDPPGN